MYSYHDTLILMSCFMNVINGTDQRVYPSPPSSYWPAIGLALAYHNGMKTFESTLEFRSSQRKYKDKLLIRAGWEFLIWCVVFYDFKIMMMMMIMKSNQSDQIIDIEVSRLAIGFQKV